jgi:hypothetical protein
MPAAGDYFMVAGPSANYVGRNGQTLRSDHESGWYYCLGTVAGQATVAIGIEIVAAGFIPGNVPNTFGIESGIPQSRILGVVRGA